LLSLLVNKPRIATPMVLGLAAARRGRELAWVAADSFASGAAMATLVILLLAH